VALPKEGNPRTYMIYENKRFTVLNLDGDEVFSVSFSK